MSETAANPAIAEQIELNIIELQLFLDRYRTIFDVLAENSRDPQLELVGRLITIFKPGSGLKIRITPHSGDIQSAASFGGDYRSPATYNAEYPFLATRLSQIDDETGSRMVAGQSESGCYEEIDVILESMELEIVANA
jgi:hypothetical protein